MALSSVYTRGQLGIEAPEVLVEVHCAKGLPKINLVGLPEIAVKESVERVRSAIINSHYQFKSLRITINLSPANLVKSGTHYDLPIAIAILKAMGELSIVDTDDLEFYGELGLDGSLKTTGGLIPAILKAADNDKKLFLPKSDASQAKLLYAPKLLSNKLFAASHLRDICAHLEGRNLLEPISFMDDKIKPVIIEKDLNEVQGQWQAKRALEIAASGFHNLLMVGPPGSGKSMLAERMAYLLPEFSYDQLKQSLSIYSVSGQSIEANFTQKRPFRSPHHSASAVALVGGGRKILPGEISLSHAGILFLDELAEFKRDVLESLRQPMEAGKIQISRATGQVEYPCQFLLIAAMNACPCGNLGSLKKSCRCTQDQISRYRAKVSGPLLDRIDIHLIIKPVEKEQLLKKINHEGSKEIRDRVINAYHRQIKRQNCPNAKLSNQQMNKIIQLDDKSKQLLDRSIDQFNLSARAYHRVLKVALTISDLADEKLSLNHIAESIGYRNNFVS